MDALLAGGFRAAVYCRLSKDDDLDGESASIANQRDMLENTAKSRAGRWRQSIRTMALRDLTWSAPT